MRGSRRESTATNPVTPMIIVNGPVAKMLQINAGYNVLGQGWRSNVTIGRALRLVLINIGGGVPGKTDKACHGQPGKLSLCIAENEEASPWEPFHVEKGFAAEDSAVSVIGVTGTQDIIHYARTSARKALDAIVRAARRGALLTCSTGGLAPYSGAATLWSVSLRSHLNPLHRLPNISRTISGPKSSNGQRQSKRLAHEWIDIPCSISSSLALP